MSKIYLNWAGAYLKIIALVAMLMFFTDMFYTASLLKPGARGGTREGRHTEKKKFLLPESVRKIFFFCKLQLKGFHLCNSEDMQHTLNRCIQQVCTLASLINMTIIIKL